MLISLDTKDKIFLELLKSPLRITLKNNKLEVIPIVRPKGYIAEITKGEDLMIDILTQIHQNDECLLIYMYDKICLLKKPQIPILFAEIILMGFKDTEPIVKIDGKLLSGYKNISKKLFNIYREDIEEVLYNYLEPQVKVEDFTLVKYKEYKGHRYPVFKYKDNKNLLHGIKALRATKLISEGIIDKLPSQKITYTKEEEVIARYHMMKADSTSVEITINNKQYYHNTIRSLYDQLRSVEKISRQRVSAIYHKIMEE